jgi:hypothetical protein
MTDWKKASPALLSLLAELYLRWYFCQRGGGDTFWSAGALLM